MARTRVRWGRVGALGVAGWFAVTLAWGGAGAASSQPAASHVYVVRPGDTLWGIATRLVGPTEDPRPVVDRLARMNRVRDGVIRAGEELVVAP